MAINTGTIYIHCRVQISILLTLYRMKRSKSGAQKRKEAATARDAVAKLPKMTDFFKITEQSRPGTSTERDEENYSVQEKEDYDDQH